MDILLIALLTLLASAVGTVTGFGTSTIMVPVLVSFLPLPQTPLLVGVVHWFGDIWKMLLFRQGVRWHLVLLFGIPGIAMSMVGGFLVFQAPEEVLSRVLGAFLLAYVVFILVKGRFKLPETTATALLGGALYGLTAGVFGVGGAVRGAFLAAYDLPKEVYIFTAGAIGLAIDTGRLATYWWQGAQLDDRLLWGLLLFVPVSFVGAKVAERIVERIPQERFRAVIATLLALIALKLLVFPSESETGPESPGEQSVFTSSKSA
jgi:hypothetical protein